MTRFKTVGNIELREFLATAELCFWLLRFVERIVAAVAGEGSRQLVVIPSSHGSGDSEIHASGISSY